MIEALFEKVCSSQKGILLSVLRALLYSVSLGYRWVVHLRNRLYESYLMYGENRVHKLFKVKVVQFDTTVVSIGNIVAGGTGKTPLTILIAQKLLEKNKKIAVLSRGYRSQLEKDPKGPFLITDSPGSNFSAKVCGDEPFLIQKKAPRAWVYVGRNRVQAARCAEQKGANILLLDDGMQYRKLHRHFDVVLVDAQDPFAKRHFLPRGHLREHPKTLKRAKLVVVNHCQNETQFKEVENELKKVTNAQIVGASLSYQRTSHLLSDENIELKGKKIAIFCGIAKPQHFLNLLKSLGAEVVSKKILSDHQEALQSELQKLAIEAKSLGAQYIICTEKDAVKLPKNLICELPIGVVEVELKVTFEKEKFENVLERMIQS